MNASGACAAWVIIWCRLKLSSVLLLVVMIGAAYLAKARRHQPAESGQSRRGSHARGNGHEHRDWTLSGAAALLFVCGLWHDSAEAKRHRHSHGRRADSQRGQLNLVAFNRFAHAGTMAALALDGQIFARSS